MLHLIQLVTSLRRDGRGVTALEYGLIASGIAMAIIGAVNGLGSAISNVFTTLSTTTW